MLLGLAAGCAPPKAAPDKGAPAGAVAAPVAPPGGRSSQFGQLPPEASAEPAALRTREEIFSAPATPPPPARIASPAAETGTGDITLNFANTEIREALRTVLGNILKVNYVIDPKVQGTVTAQTSQPISRDAVLPMIELILQANGATMVEAHGLYSIVPLDQGAHAAMARDIAIGSAQRSLGFGLRIIPLKFVAAAEVQKVVEPLLPLGGSLRADAAHNILIVTGTQPELEGFVDIVQSLDVDYLRGMSFALFTLRNASPMPMVDELNKIFSSGGAEGQEAPMSSVVRFVPLDRLNAVLAISSQRAYIDRVRGWVERLDRADAEGEPRLHVYHVQNSRATDLAAVLGDLFASAAVSTELPQGITAPGTAAAEIGPSRTQPPLPGQPSGAGPSGPSLSPPPPAPGTGAAGSSPLSLAQGQAAIQPPARPSGQAAAPRRAGLLGPAPGAAAAPAAPGEAPPVRIVADEKNNALIIYAATRDYRMIMDAVRQLDIVPLQVLIEATIAEVTLNDELRFGVQYFLREGAFHFNLVNPNAPAAGIVPTVPGFALSLGRSTAYAILSALKAITNVNVISSPQVMVLDHQNAYLQVGDQVPISIGQATNLNNPNTVLVNTIQYRDTGVILTVTPRVNANGLVSMDIQQEVSAVAATTSSSINSPTIQERRIQSSVAIQSGDTIALGGLIKDDRTRSESGIPILADIPVLGALFGSRENTGVRTELLVLLTPHVIGSSLDAREVTEELRRRLRSVNPLSRAIQ